MGQLELTHLILGYFDFFISSLIVHRLVDNLFFEQVNMGASL